MALGGGTFVTQNKILPGTYINFVSASRANTALSERGIVTFPIALDWGDLDKIIEVTAENIQKDTVKMFGYDFTAEQMKPLREVFKNSHLCYLYRLGTGGTKAANAYGTAKYIGTRGNALTIVVQDNVDDASKKDVTVLMNGTLVAAQTVGAAAELVDDDYVAYDKGGVLALTAGTPMTGGTNPTVTNADYQSYLNAVEGYSFNAIACPNNDPTIKTLFAAFTRRMRDEQGVKFQCVVYNHEADYEGVVNIMNSVSDEGAEAYSLVYWVTGVIGGTAVNKSATNNVYDGEYTVNVNYTQVQLEDAIKSGKFALHRVNDSLRVLSDINSLVTLTDEKNEDFKQNQTIRVIDQIANDIAVLFAERYLGEIPNDESGRISLWADIVRNREELQNIRAIEEYDSSTLMVEQGDTKRAVLVRESITPINAMSQLYMTVSVS